MRRKILLAVMTLSLLFCAMGVEDLYALNGSSSNVTSGLNEGETSDGYVSVSSYEELKTALQKSGNYKLTADITVTEQIEVPFLSGDYKPIEITLDLNGHKITADGKIYPINNNGKLTINDSQGTGVIEGLGLLNGKDGASGNTRSAAAVLTINGGTYKNLYDEGAALYAYLGSITINGGRFIGKHAAIWNENANYINIYGGYFEGDYAAIINEKYILFDKGELNGLYLGENGYSCVVSENVIVYEARIVKDSGYTSYKKLADAVSAAAEGDEIMILTNHNGSYKVPSGKNITITGADVMPFIKEMPKEPIKFANICAHNMGGASMTFNNVTFEYTNADYTGLQHSGDLVYNNCTFNGQPFLYGNSETFNKCTFNQTSSDAYNVWTYGAKTVNFNECVFNSAGKSVLIYKENDPTFIANVNVTKCTFTASTAVADKAAIEMDSSLTGGINLTIDGETTATGFAGGNVSGNQLWNNKKGNDNNANNDITVVVGGVTVLEPIYMAKNGETKHRTLQEAINAAQNGETITLLSDIAENVTLTEKTGLYYTIDGDGKNMNGTITVNSLSDTNDNRRITIKNIKFVDTADTKVDFISSVNTNHYPRLTVEGCTFTGSGNDGDVAVRLKSSHSVVIKDCTGTGLHSFLQNTSGWNLTIENVTVTYSKSGLALGTVQGVTVKGSKIVVDGYGIRMDAQYNNNAVIESNNVEAFIPVVVRKASENSKITFAGTNTMTATNIDGLWCAIGASEYETNGSLPTAATGKVTVTLNDAGLDPKGVYGNYQAIKLQDAGGNLISFTDNFEKALADAIANANVARIEIFDNYTQTSVENTENYYDVTRPLKIGAPEGKNVVASGCGFAIRVKGEGATLTIEKGLTIEGLDVVANGFSTNGESMNIDGTLKALSLKQWTSNGTITVSETGSVVLGYGDGQFDMAYGNGTVTINGNGDKTAAQFKAGYSGTRGDGNTLNLNNTCFEGGAWFNVNGSNGTFNINNSLLKVSGGDAAGTLTVASSGNSFNLTNGAELNVAKLTLGAGNEIIISLDSKINATTLSGAGVINIDATGFENGEVCVVKADMSSFTGAINITGANYIIKKGDGLYVTGPQGTMTKAYTSATGYWGECGGNANESFVFKFYNGNTYMGQTSLKDENNIIDGDVYVTWHIDLDADSNTDEYWTMSWEERPTLAMQPNRVEQWVDGVKVAECALELNWSDSTFPVIAAVTDSEGVILSYVNNNNGATLQNAFNAGGNITAFRDITLTEKLTIPADKTVTFDLSGKTINAPINVIENNGTLAINDKVGTAKVYTTDVAAQGRATIVNNGDIVINAGWFGDSNNDVTDRNAINRGNAIKNSGTATINGGYFTNVSNQYIGTDAYAYAINTLEGGNTTINKATVYGDINGLIYSDGETIVNDGSFTLGRPDEENNLWYLAYGNVKIKGGTWTRAFTVPSWNTGNPTFYGGVEVSGGSFNVEFPGDFLAEGFMLIENTDGTYGVINNPDIIENLAELKAFRDKVNAGDNYAGKTVVLAANIDLNNEEWTPIGNDEKPFNGTFDGQDNTISNLVITGYNSNVGFFGRTNNGEIKDITINNAKVSGRLNVGVVAGTPYTSKYTNIKVTGHVEVNGMSYVGGVGGKNAYADWTNITVDVDETSYVEANSVEDDTAYRTYVGGVIGFNGEGSHTFTNITSNINVIGSTCDIGGIFGILHYSNKIKDVSCSANVTSQSEAEELGGIAGVWHNQDGTNVSISNVTFTGKVYDVNGEVTGVDIVGGAYQENGTGTITGSEAVVNGTTYETLAEAIAEAESGDVVELLTNVNATEVILIDKDLTINGNGYDVTSSASRVFRVSASNTEVTLNNVNMISTAVRVGTDDVRGISIDANLSNVSLTLNNCSVEFTDESANDWTYAVNVSGNGTGHKVTVDGGTYEGANVINVHGASNAVVVKNATINCTYPNNDMYAGACIWVLKNQNSSVEATGNIFNGDNAVAFNLGEGTALTESDNTDNTEYVVVRVSDTYYYSLAEAVAAAQDDETIKVLHNIALSETIKNTKNVILDLNGKTITGTDNNTSGNFYLIDNVGTLTVTGNGTITLAANTNRQWNSSSVVIANNPGGKLTIENGTIEHLGGTDMAYAIDNLTNGKGTYAETVINGGTMKSTYRAVRQFLNGIEAQNILTVNGGTIEGANKSIWMQDPSKNANTGKLTVGEGASLKGDVYLYVTEGSTEWPVEVAIAAAALADESTVVTANVPDAYVVVEKDGEWGIYGTVAMIEDAKYATLAEALAEAVSGDVVILLDNVKFVETLETPAGITLDGNGKVIDGSIKAGGDLTFAGSTTITTFNAGWYNNTITIGEGAGLKVTGGRVTVSYGNVFNIIGSITDAKTADKTALTPSLEIVSGISYNGDGGEVQFNVTNAYVKLGDSTTKNSGATGKFNTNVTNSIVEFTKALKTYMPTKDGLDPEFNITAKDSKISFASHLELWLNKTNFTLDNSELTVGGSFANAGTVTVKNGANFVVNAPIMNSHGGNTGIINIENATFELKDSNQDWENAGSINVKDSGKLIINDFLVTADGTMNVDSSEVNHNTEYGKFTNNGTVNIKDATVKIKKLDNDKLMFISGTNTLKVEDASGSSFSLRARDGVVFNDSYVKGTANEIMRLLGSATFNGNFECAYLQGKNADESNTDNNGVGGTITIEEGTTVHATYGVEFSNNYVLNGGTIELSGGNADGSIWGCVFQSGEYTINSNVIVNGGGETAPIHFTNATAVVNGNITHSNPGGEVIYLKNSKVTFAETSTVSSTAGVYVNEGATLYGKGNVNGTLKENGGDVILTGGIYTQDVNEFCHEDYKAIAMGDGRWMVVQVSGTQTRELPHAGWYWFSTYITYNNEETALDALQAALGSNASLIKGQNAFTQYLNYNGTNFWTSDLTALSTAQMYMIKTTADDVTVELTGNFEDYANTNIELKQGWNWIGYPINEAVSLNDAIPTEALKDGDIIKDQTSSARYYVNFELPNGSTFTGWDGQLKEMKPGHGYMFKSVNGATFSYTTNSNGSRSTLNTVDFNGDNHWIADATQYPNNMNIVAMMSIDGEIVKDNYEVAAFANGECRGSARPVYIEALDSYVLYMTIHGEDMAELTFKYYDVNYGTEYELDNILTYSSDAIIGSLKEPYMFALNIMNIDEISLSEINIYPNPTTTGAEINLQATCDKVEVYNSLGVKIAEYQNVDSIDALETAGIYVIRITDNNEVKHCRLIVK